MSRSLIALLAVPYARAYGIAKPTDGSCPAGGCVLAHWATQVPVGDFLGLLQQSARGARGGPRPVPLTTPHGASNQDYPCGVRRQGSAISKPLMFVHFHKAGGTVICNLAKDNGEYAEEPACVQGVDAYQWFYRTDIGKPYTCEERCRYMEMTRFTFASIERVFKDADYCPDMFEYATVVRDPISLMESYLNFETQESGSTMRPSSGTPDAETLKSRMKACLLDDDAESCQRPLIPTNVQSYFVHFDNYMVRVLGGPTAMQLPPKAVNATHLKKALDVLASFDTVLRFEDLWNANNTVLQQAFGWNNFLRLQAPPTVWDHPVSEHSCQLSEREKADFRILNKYDYELYNSVKPS